MATTGCDRFQNPFNHNLCLLHLECFLKQSCLIILWHHQKPIFIHSQIGEKGDWAFELQGHKDFVSCLDFNYDGQFLASGCFHGIVQVWDASRNLKNVFEGLGGGIEGM
ncbi:hypothetical protein glysoja_049546 [Glycine soja]|uniref:Uncharacterized protein n=1 Tax=Glycine soja TaxID=3848 RepID=A0A0B2QF50_GLYSO|nr:hypothetical protein glysoja_049546 [Glycine soja]